MVTSGGRWRQHETFLFARHVDSRAPKRCAVLAGVWRQMESASLTEADNWFEGDRVLTFKSRVIWNPQRPALPIFTAIGGPFHVGNNIGSSLGCTAEAKFASDFIAFRLKSDGRLLSSLFTWLPRLAATQGQNILFCCTEMKETLRRVNPD